MSLEGSSLYIAYLMFLFITLLKIYMLEELRDGRVTEI